MLMNDSNGHACSPEQEADVIREICERVADSATEAGIFNLIYYRWWQAWCAYTGYTLDRQLSQNSSGPHSRPGPIQNDSLIDATTPADALCRLHGGLQEGRHFKLVPAPAWDHLVSWYGGGPALARPFLASGLGGHRSVEVYPRSFKVHCQGRVALSSKRPALAYPEESVKVLKQRALMVAPSLLSEDTHEMWVGSGQTAHKSLEADLGKTVAEAGLSVSDSIVLISKADADAGQADTDEAADSPAFGPHPASQETDMPSPTPIPMPLGSSYSPYAHTPPRIISRTFSKEDAVTLSAHVPSGMAGLRNLGNTCFMASSVQCLMHTPPLLRPFLDGSYRQDLNKANPLGLHGELAEAFAALALKLWQGGASSVSPIAFKAKVAKFAPQFQGYAQQDGQELLAFLLDGLHEDLNRILEKPYVAEAEDHGRSDADMAAEAWANYRRRNDSVIVDHLQGLYKSTLVCPDCRNRSVKFDPFTYLTLQLPSSKARPLTICLLAMDGSRPPCTYSIDIPNAGSVAHVYRALARAAGVDSPHPEEVLLLAEVRNGLLSELHTDPKASAPEPFVTMMYSSHPTPPFLAYLYPDAARGPRAPGLRRVHVMHRERPQPSTYRLQSRDLFAVPLVLFVPEHEIVVRPEPATSTSQPGMVEFGIEQSCGLASSVRLALRPFQRQGTSGTPPALHNDIVMHSNLTSFPTPEVLQDGSDDGSLPELQPAASVASQDDEEPGRRSSVTAQGSDASSIGPMDTPISSPRVSPPGSPRSAEGAEQEGGEMLPPGLVPPDALPSDLPPPFHVPFNVDVPSSKSEEPQPMSLSGPTVRDSALAASQSDMASPRPIFSQAVPQSTPFDMWSEQPSPGKEPHPAAASSGGPRTHFTYNGMSIASEPHQEGVWAPVEGGEGQQPEGRRPAPAGSRDLDMRLCSSLGELCTSSRADLELPGEEEPVGVAMIWAPSMEAAYDITILERPERHESMHAAEERQHRGPPKHTLHECIEAFLQPEQLGLADSWYCSRCKAHVQADKKLDLWSLPEVLIIHLKRFSFSRYRRNKLDNEVTFPLTGLDLSPYLLQSQAVSPLYDLYAVSNHYGGLGGGHYTAFCQVEGQGWAHFNDSDVSPQEPADVQSSAAYLLFYRRRAELEQDSKGLSHATRTVGAQQIPAGLGRPNGLAMPLSNGVDHNDGPNADEDDLYGTATMDGLSPKVATVHASNGVDHSAGNGRGQVDSMFDEQAVA